MDIDKRLQQLRNEINQKKESPRQPTKEEFERTLNFMFSVGAIDHQQYTDLQIKTLPFL